MRLAKAGAWPHQMTVAHTSNSSAMAALELDASVMEALAAHVTAACSAEQLQSSGDQSATTASGVYRAMQEF